MKPKGYWSKEKCKEEALKYLTRKEFSIKSKSAYYSAYKNKWLEDICFHMKEVLKPKGYWTYDKCKEISLLYTYKKDLISKNKKVYQKIINNKWYDLFNHFIESEKPKGYWSKEKCKEEALKYNYRKDFEDNCSSAYTIILKNKWYNMMYHMKTKQNDNNRCIYSFEFSDNCVYVGLTDNFNKRKKQHISNKNSSIYKHIEKTNLTPIIKILSKYINKDLAAIKEGKIMNTYKANGWNILNKAKTGALGGGNYKWNYENCQNESLKYISRNEFKKKSKSAYCAALKNNWMDKICSHIITIKKIPTKYWTKERCKEEALKYNSRKVFGKMCSGAYRTSLKNKWIDEICLHMNNLQNKIIWSYDKCKEEASKYNTKKEFKINCAGAYSASHRNNWLNNICIHMIKSNRIFIWTYEKCKEEALKYNTKMEFMKKCKGAYSAALRQKWFKEITTHMIKFKRQKWSKEKCLDEANQYIKYIDFIINSKNAYSAAYKNNWLEDIKSIFKK